MKFLSTLLTFVSLILAAPTVLILASWNALPGDALYPFKKGLETITLAVTGGTPLAAKFSVQFTERRFSEANKLLTTQGSTVGFTLLVEEAKQSKDIIVEKSDTQTAGELLFKIEEYQKNIVTQQEALTAQPLTSPAPQVIIPPQPTPEVQEPVLSPITVVTQTPTPTPTPEVEKPLATPVLLPKITEPVKAQEVVMKLEETKHDLEKIKDEIKKDLPEAAQKAKELQEERHDAKEQKGEQKERKD
ncbi:MAG: hypothetical protein HY377_01880 [Candidatus Blackburnbacteria bacterium]|nr:hypothetical protein [Candidatus Blackburnbacteria bacterium]